MRGAPDFIGVLLGEQSGSTDVDCDCPEAITAARGLLPETGLIFGRESQPFSHYLYPSDPPLQTQQFHDPLDHATLIELRRYPQTEQLGCRPSFRHASTKLVSGFVSSKGSILRR